MNAVPVDIKAFLKFLVKTLNKLQIVYKVIKSRINFIT